MSTTTLQVDSALATLAQTHVSQFYPSGLAQLAQVSLRDTLEALPELVRVGKIKLRWHVLCEECTRVLAEVQAPEDRAGDAIACPTCGTETEISDESLFLVVEITDDYKGVVKKNGANR